MVGVMAIDSVYYTQGEHFVHPELHHLLIFGRGTLCRMYSAYVGTDIDKVK